VRLGNEDPSPPRLFSIRSSTVAETAAIMSSDKRPASDDFGGGQMVVKRPNLGKDSKAVATVNGSGANGALIQAVRTAQRDE